MTTRKETFTQLKTFTAWCNWKIASRGNKFNNLCEDLATGVLFITLLEELTSKSVPHNTLPTNRVQFVDNCSQALALMKSEGIRLSVYPEDVVNCNQNCVLSIIWALILQYDFNRTDTRNKIKKDLLNWLNFRLNNYNIKIADFLSVWKDGNIICALVDSFQPGVMDPKIIKESPIEKARKAMTYAEVTYNIPMILDPVDMIENPDELSIMTYINGFFKKESMDASNNIVLNIDEKEITIHGKGLEKSIIGITGMFMVIIRDKNTRKLNEVNKEDFKVVVEGPQPTTIVTTRIKEGIYQFSYEPKVSGDYFISLHLNKSILLEKHMIDWTPALSVFGDMPLAQELPGPASLQLDFEEQLIEKLSLSNSILQNLKLEILGALDLVEQSPKGISVDLKAIQSIINQLQEDEKNLECTLQTLRNKCEGLLKNIISSQKTTEDDEIDTKALYSPYTLIIDNDTEEESLQEKESTFTAYSGFVDDGPEEQNISNEVQEMFFQEKEKEDTMHVNKEKSDSHILSKWDEEFSYIRKHHPGEKEVLTNHYQKMANLADNFIAAASIFSQMIVAEQHVTEREKKIKPLDVGGVAGGTKYSVHGLFFKYPVDTCIDQKHNIWLYGGVCHDDNLASKASNHDLKGLVYCMGADDQCNFNFPILGLIDYEGFRLTVMTHLPISKHTLVYGSDDGGHTIHSDPDVHEKLKQIANKLNLKPHLVTKEHPVEMALCGDVEIHKFQNEDEKLIYAVDLARVFPPSLPGANSPAGSIFFRLLRPELVKSLNFKLSSDAMSAWQTQNEEAKINNKEIEVATEFLRVQVQEFAKEISDERVNDKYIYTAFTNAKNPTFNGLSSKETIIRDLHKRGINIRYIGLLVTKMEGKNTKMINFLLGIIVTRAIKNMWRNQIRKAKGKNIRIHELCLKTTITVLNLLPTPDNSDTVTDIEKQNFRSKLTNFVETMFGKGVMTSIECNYLLDIFESANDIPIWWVIIRFCEICGIVMNQARIQSLVTGDYQLFTRADIVRFIPIIKFPPILDYYAGVSYLLKAKEADKLGIRSTLYRYAEERLVHAINYEFPNIREYYAEAQFEIMKYDRSYTGNMKEISKVYKTRWERNNSVIGTPEHLEYMYSVLWQDLFSQKSKTDVKAVHDGYLDSDNETIEHLLECLKSTQKNEVIRIITDFQTSMLNIDEQLSEIRKLCVSDDPFASILLEKGFFLKLDPKVLEKLLEEAKNWDIDIEKKYWFFMKYFSLSDLVKFSKDRGINLTDNEHHKFLLLPSPCLLSLFFYGDLSLYEHLVDMGVEDLELSSVFNLSDEYGSTPLYKACENNYPAIVQLLLKNKANVNIYRKDGYTPLHIACSKGHLSAVEVLLNNNANINADDQYGGSTPLHIACSQGNISVVEKLLNNNSNINSNDQLGSTPLYKACEKGHSAIVQLLLNNKANVNVDCEDIAKRHGHTSIVLTLQQHKQ